MQVLANQHASASVWAAFASQHHIGHAGKECYEKTYSRATELVKGCLLQQPCHNVDAAALFEGSVKTLHQYLARY